MGLSREGMTELGHHHRKGLSQVPTNLASDNDEVRRQSPPKVLKSQNFIETINNPVKSSGYPMHLLGTQVDIAGVHEREPFGGWGWLLHFCASPHCMFQWVITCEKSLKTVRDSLI